MASAGAEARAIIALAECMVLWKNVAGAFRLQNHFWLFPLTFVPGLGHGLVFVGGDGTVAPLQ